MKFEKGAMYQVIDCSNCMLIMNYADKLGGRPDAKPLMAGPPEAVAEFVARYIALREAGKDRDKACDVALQGAKAVVLPVGGKLN